MTQTGPITVVAGHDTVTAHTTTTVTGSARRRLVGVRTGFLADFVVAVVRVADYVRERAGAVVRRAVGVVTPLGWAVLASIPIAFGVGYGLGWLELVLVGWALVVVAVVAAASLLGRTGVEVAVDLPHHRVVAGDAASGRVTVRNPGALRTAGTTLEVPIGPGIAEFAIPGLRGHGEAERPFSVPTARRGVITIGPVRSVRGDPVGLVRREVVWADAVELVVHPRTISAPSTSMGLINDLEGQATRDLTASDVAFHALREYQRGDERRYIHWKSSAKTGTYMVRQFEQTRRSHLVVALSLAPEDYADDEEFELAVSVSASLGVRAVRDGRSVSVVVSTVPPEYAKRAAPTLRALATHRPDRLLDEFALVELEPGAIGVREVARVIADRLGAVSLAFLVCGSTVPLAQLRAAASSFSPDVAVVAVVCNPEAQPGLRRVAGFSLLGVGFLDDLRSALVRTAAAG